MKRSNWVTPRAWSGASATAADTSENTTGTLHSRMLKISSWLLEPGCCYRQPRAHGPHSFSLALAYLPGRIGPCTEFVHVGYVFSKPRHLHKTLHTCRLEMKVPHTVPPTAPDNLLGDIHISTGGYGYLTDEDDKKANKQCSLWLICCSKRQPRYHLGREPVLRMWGC